MLAVAPNNGWEIQSDSPAETMGRRGGSGASSQGTLFLVGTPIGNLEDITLRALRVLQEADLIACEDTRQTRKLLNHFAIEKRTTSYHEHNETEKSAELVRRMEEGLRIALVSDAGMPGLSDPGYRLVERSIRHGIPVVPVPGVSAVVSALTVSGLPTHGFQFAGFLPAKPHARRKVLEQFKESPVTTVVFESPRRVLATLRDIHAVLGDRSIAVAREMTKLHEEFLRGRCSEVIDALAKRPAILGEITLILGPASESADKTIQNVPVKERVRQLMAEEELSRMEALKTVARERGISKREAYREFES